VVTVENVGSPLRHLVVASGDFFLASVLATCLTKLVIRSYGAPDIKIAAKNSFCVEVLLVLTALLKLDERPHAAAPEAGGGRGGGGGTDPDSYARVCLCIKTLASPQVLVFGEQAFLRDCRDSFASLLLEQRSDKEERDAKKEKKVEVQADDLISLHHLLLGSKLATGDHGKDLEAIDLIRATGFVNAPPGTGSPPTRQAASPPFTNHLPMYICIFIYFYARRRGPAAGAALPAHRLVRPGLRRGLHQRAAV
jgi:coatomer subunit beta